MSLISSEAGASRSSTGVRVPVSEVTQAGEARRTARSLAQEAGFDASFSNNASILVSELATNLARYATAGEILVQVQSNGDDRWLNVFAIDRGPGIEDVARSLADGYSTGGTAGNGLGAVQRVATEFEIYSAQPGGTVVYARLDEQKRAKPDRFRWGGVCRPTQYESACGDAWRVCERDGLLSILLADGLGHGPEAAAAANEAVTAFDQAPFDAPATLMKAIDLRMRGTRGGAIAIAQIDLDQRLLKYVGVGNIAGSLRDLNGASGRGMFSHYGIAGVQLRKIQEFEYPLPTNGFLVMHSDGLQTRWSFDPYLGLLRRHPAVVAGILYRDFTRGRDDVTVAVIELPAAE